MITATRQEALVAKVQVRTHEFLSGVVEKLGGHDEGPNPHELLEAALAACTIITAQMYADRKQIKLSATDVVVRILEEGPQTKIAREVNFRGDITEEQRLRLTEIIDKCPVHKLLQSQITIETSVKG